MPPSDKNKSSGNSTSGKNQNQLCSESCVMDFPRESTPPSTSNVTLSGHGTIINIPWVTASQSTIKCSVNDQMKTFDPGEDGGVERLTTSNNGNAVIVDKNNCNLYNKNSTKNYKAGSKINKLADMLAKRSQNVVEVKESNQTSDIIIDANSSTVKDNESVIRNSVSNIMTNGSLFENGSLYRKSRRKSVPNQTCSLYQWQHESTSKSCSDLLKLFPLEESDKNERMNALGRSALKLQTEESTKRKVIRKNLRNVKLPLILPEKKKRATVKNDSFCKQFDKVNYSSVASIEIPKIESSKPSVKCAKVKNENKVKQRKSKRLVENSTQTADIEFISVIRSNTEMASEKSAEDKSEKPVYECLYCSLTFVQAATCKAHEKTHTVKQLKCQYCSKKLTSFEEFKAHCIQKHPNKYAYCLKCDERYSTKEELDSHNKEVHVNKAWEMQNLIQEESVQERKQEEMDDRTDKKLAKTGLKCDLKVDVSYDSTKKSSVSPRNVQKCSPKETKTEEQLLEMEMLFYSHLSGNIQENLANHLDGKLDKSGNPIRTDQITELPDSTKASNLLSMAAPNTGIPDVQISRAPSPYQTRSKTPNPLPPTAKKFKKLPNWQQKFWEKYNFPTNYRLEHRFWDKNYLNTEKSAFYLKDLSCLDIKTQLTMRENIKKLDEIKKMEENSKCPDNLKFPEYLSLVPRTNNAGGSEVKVDAIKSNVESGKNKKQIGKESFKSPGFELPVVKNRSKEASTPVRKQTVESVKMMTRRQSSLEFMKEDKDEKSKKRKGSLDLSGSQKMALRRQTSLDNLGGVGSKVEKPESSNEDVENTPLSPPGSAEISGEWVRPRSYLCGTCCMKFTNLWELEDHKWVSHPNVWCTHYEFEDEKIDKLFQKNEDPGNDGDLGESSEMPKSKLTDLYKRYLLPYGSLKTAKLVPKTNFPEQCTKCKKNCMNSSEMHKHILDCGGDTTWFLTMYSSPMTIKRKWRPFGSRRKKQIGRRDVKRNIPSTPTLRSYHYQHRIRTKPGDVETIQKMLANLPEKRARRAINFDEIKTRSQATIHSNRLLRKRFKTSFSNNFLKLKSLKQKRQLKQNKKEGSSKSTTDTSSENTPIGSPKRRNKLKESLQLLKEENSRDGSSETSECGNVKINKKKIPLKRKSNNKTEGSKAADKPKIKKEAEKEKSSTKNNGLVINVDNSKSKRKTAPEEIDQEGSSSNEVTQPKNKPKPIKNTKPGKNKKIKKEISKDVAECENQKKMGVAKKTKEDNVTTVTSSDPHWVNTRCNPILRLKQANKAKTELLKTMQKKLKNSRKILKNKDAQRGSRRSSRLKSLQQIENESEITDKSPVEISEKDIKMKTMIVSLENTIVCKPVSPSAGKTSRTTGGRVEKEVLDLPMVRRSLRNSISSESVPTKSEEPNARSLLRKNTRSEKDSDNAVSVKTPRLSLDCKTPEVAVPKKTRVITRTVKLGIGETGAKNDLEEMPILAKVEPIRGKTVNRNEKEIPILHPVEKSQEEEEEVKDSVSFQVIKKRRKNSKEITPLKIVKKLDGKGTTDSEIGGTDESGQTRKKKKYSEFSVTSTKEVKTDGKKYFLGIDPTEIDKGRIDGQDDSGSDSEPLICLITQAQNEPEKEEPNKTELESLDAEAEKISEEPITKCADNKVQSPNITAEKSEPNKNEELKNKSSKSSKVKPHKKKNNTSIKRELCVAVPSKQSVVEIIDKPIQIESKEGLETKSETVEVTVEESDTTIVQESVLPQRRSRRISKETKTSNEFVIDDPLILVDELWSDLDSDSDTTRRKSKKGKKKTPKKKTSEDRKICDVNLEELLRNFGEKKETKKEDTRPVVKVRKNPGQIRQSLAGIRKAAENLKPKKSYKRLSLKLFRFHKSFRNFGNRGVKLSEAKKALPVKLDEIQGKSSTLPDLPFLASEIKENPVQVIQCGVAKPKGNKKGVKKADIRMKISLPLEIVNSMTVFNNNHLTEPILEEPKPIPDETLHENCNLEKEPSEKLEEKENNLGDFPLPMVENQDAMDVKNKSKRSEVIDKIFYCEICKTYYYSSSQLKIHKLSNRHKLKESELQQVKKTKGESPRGLAAPMENLLEKQDAEKLNEDMLEMPVLEGPFIESPLTRVTTAESVKTPTPPPPPVSNNFGFSQESLKDIQKAIGCTDEEMLILTLLGENTIEIENDILDLDSCKSTEVKPAEVPKDKVESSSRDNGKADGSFSIDLKQRMTSALTCLVNKAVFNLLQKYETAARSAVNPEALSLLGKLSNLSRRKNIIQLNDLLKKRNDGESSLGLVSKDTEKKEPTISYKYQCTICGSRFEKASTRECHISRSHRGKAKKVAEEVQASQTIHEDEWNESWNYDNGDDHLGTNTSQFWCSDCGINFLSPKEVLEHQKLEHQAVLKDPEHQNKDSGPLQSSTIGSSDEILEGKKIRRRPKLFSSEELDQQRILANNELRKLDRKFSNKSKNNKIKWGMDALKFTVEKENKIVVEEEEKEVTAEQTVKPAVDVKNIDLVPKLNLSRISNIPEFKVIQKNSFENRFQKIIDNKLKRKCLYPSQEESATDEIEEEVMLVPVVVKKKNKKSKTGKCVKKEEIEKPLDVYDFNESESEGEPAVYSHIKKPSTPKLKLVKVKEGPSKNKADSTTKDLAPDDYDSEDSLPLSVVKKSKPEEEDDDKDERVSDDGMEKSDGILEQVEYLIEQLENETASSKSENVTKKTEFEEESEKTSEEVVEENVAFSESLRVSVANEFLELEDLQLKSPKPDEANTKSDKVEDIPNSDSLLPEPESSQSTFDEEDSIPLVLISKKTEKSKYGLEEKKTDENTTDVSTTASEDANLNENKSNDSTMPTEESLSEFSRGDNENVFCEKPVKHFETLNGNVIYCRNESVTDFESELSSDSVIDSNFEKNAEETFINEITEKEDVVIVCSKGVENESKLPSTEESESQSKKKKRQPLLTATLEENNFRKSESPKSNKEDIVRKIWSRKKLAEDITDEDSFVSFDENNTSMEILQEEDSQTEIEKEIIVKKIWSRKKHEFEDETSEKVEEKFDDIKINKTEISDEVVIKCGPKTKASPKRRRSKSSTNETSKDTIMRKIWSGKCAFQTKAALKTYDSDMLPNCKENEIVGSPSRSKRRRRPTSFSSTKRSKIESEADDDEEDDDLDSLLEEIEREQLEKAIRSEFLQLRRSEKANVEMKEVAAPTVGIFAETTFNPKKEILEKKRRKAKKKIKHPRQSVLKRKKLIRRPFRRVLPSEERNFSESTNFEGSTEQSENDRNASLGAEGKTKNRKHKKHRHKHHHHKHKHKKSKHHKSGVGKHKTKRESEESKDGGEEEEEEETETEAETGKPDSFTLLKKICQDIPNHIENESLASKVSETLESQRKNGGSEEFEKKRYESVYDFVEEFSGDESENLKK